MGSQKAPNKTTIASYETSTFFPKRIALEDEERSKLLDGAAAGAENKAPGIAQRQSHIKQLKPQPYHAQLFTKF